MPLTLDILEGRLAVCRLARNHKLPHVPSGPLVSLTRTEDELSLICMESEAPEGARVERGFRALKVRGPLGFSWTGILASLATPLARAGISILSIATYDTDYILVREVDLAKAVDALRLAEHKVFEPGSDGAQDGLAAAQNA